MNKNNYLEASRSQVNSFPTNPDVAPTSTSRAKEIAKRIIAVLGITAVATFSGACDDQQNSQQGYQPEWHDAQAQRAFDDVIEQQNFLQAQAADYAARQANEPQVVFPTPDNQYAPPEFPKCELYVVKDGDTLSSIAFSLGFTDPYDNPIAATALQIVNRLQSDRIFQGQTLNVFYKMTGNGASCVPQ